MIRKTSVKTRLPLTIRICKEVEVEVWLQDLFGVFEVDVLKVARVEKGFEYVLRGLSSKRAE